MFPRNNVFVIFLHLVSCGLKSLSEFQSGNAHALGALQFRAAASSSLMIPNIPDARSIFFCLRVSCCVFFVSKFMWTSIHTKKRSGCFKEGCQNWMFTSFLILLFIFSSFLVPLSISFMSFMSFMSFVFYFIELQCERISMLQISFIIISGLIILFVCDEMWSIGNKNLDIPTFLNIFPGIKVAHNKCFNTSIILIIIISFILFHHILFKAHSFFVFQSFILFISKRIILKFCNNLHASFIIKYMHIENNIVQLIKDVLNWRYIIIRDVINSKYYSIITQIKKAVILLSTEHGQRIIKCLRTFPRHHEDFHILKKFYKLTRDILVLPLSASEAFFNIKRLCLLWILDHLLHININKVDLLKFSCHWINSNHQPSSTLSLSTLAYSDYSPTNIKHVVTFKNSPNSLTVPAGKIKHAIWISLPGSGREGLNSFNVADCIQITNPYRNTCPKTSINTHRTNNCILFTFLVPRKGIEILKCLNLINPQFYCFHCSFFTANRQRSVALN
ncbi:putative signal peptide protein [Puccinia sorghi]|uniref:Putative signal peptide protein n=1 Tax=Puccinia sorghi TaxID=27349 RepID=A0A0L6UZP5_9BASI|nr:putative signal peptide protein [Puccinia sorghi]